MPVAILWAAALAAAVVAACDDGDAPAGSDSDASAVHDAAVDAAGAHYGDGVCTEREFMQGNEAIQITTDLAAGGPNLVAAYVADHREMLDGIWEDCKARLCPVVSRIHEQCASNFVDPSDDDAGLSVGNPCGAAPAECDQFR